MADDGDYPYIQGHKAGSWNEVYVARALDKYKINYQYQYSIHGGARLRGGIIVDFVVSNPFRVPVEVYGKYWHSGQLGADDRLKLAAEANYFGRQTVVIWDYECTDQQQADQVVKERLAK